MVVSRQRVSNLRDFGSRYGAWDGSQTFPDVDTGKVFDQLAEYFFQYNDVTISLHLIMREGVMDADGNPVIKGIEALLEELQERRDELLEQYNLENSLDEIRDALRDIEDMERKAIEKQQKGLSPEEVEQRNDHLDNPPRQVSKHLRHLADYKDDPTFLDKEAEKKLDELLQQGEDIEQVERFREHFPFSGDESLDFEQTKELMEMMRLLEEIEQALKNGRWSLKIEFPEGTSPEDLREALGDELYNEMQRLQSVAQRLEDKGYLKRKGDRYQLTPRGKRRIGEKALRDIFNNVDKDRLGRHPQLNKGSSSAPTDQTKRYTYGDSMFIEMSRTLRNAMIRGAVTDDGPMPQIHIQPDDFEVHQTEYRTKSATALLLDTSWSMAWFNRFTAAKKVAVALNSLIRTQHPTDTMHVIGFDAQAREIQAEELMDASWAGGVYGTNMQHALQIARRLLAKEGAKNKQVIMISDGEPTAHYDHGRLFFQYPPSQRTLDATLREVKRCTRENITINIFMLEEYSYLREFVDKITKINRGRAFFTTPDQLGKYVLVDYKTHKRKLIR